MIADQQAYMFRVEVKGYGKEPLYYNGDHFVFDKTEAKKYFSQVQAQKALNQIRLGVSHKPYVQPIYFWS